MFGSRDPKSVARSYRAPKRPPIPFIWRQMLWWRIQNLSLETLDFQTANSQTVGSRSHEWVARCETAQNPPKSTFTHRQTIHAASMGTAEAPSKMRRTLASLVDAVHADFVKVSRSQGISRFSHGIHKAVSAARKVIRLKTPSPTHGGSPTGCYWSAATSHRDRRLVARSDRSRPCACEHKRPARAPLASWEVL